MNGSYTANHQYIPPLDDETISPYRRATESLHAWSYIPIHLRMINEHFMVQMQIGSDKATFSPYMNLVKMYNYVNGIKILGTAICLLPKHPYLSRLHLRRVCISILLKFIPSDKLHLRPHVFHVI